MSVDCDANLAYGWIVEYDDLTDRFHELNENEFDELDGKFFGYWYAYELVTVVDAYSDRSAYHIGLPIQVQKRKYDGDRWVGFENFSASELAEECASLKDKDDELRALYEAVMGEMPPCPPTVDLFVSWW